jgi:hypothetical protein
MTNGANYQSGKLHYGPLYSDIHTSNQLNTPAGRLLSPFQTTTVNKEEGELINPNGSPRNKIA